MDQRGVSQAELARLRAQWATLLRAFAPDPADATHAFDDLVAAYASPGRFYHTLAHVQQVLQTIDRLGDLAQHLSAVQLAGWFHDLVYDSKADDNEVRSAVCAGEVLGRLNVPEETRGRVRELILRTRTHETSADDVDGHVLLDADLAILGAPAEDYARYAEAIRREYAWVPEDQYRSGRAQVLRRFLARPRIYLTGPMFEQLERRARENLQNEIGALGGGGHA